MLDALEILGLTEFVWLLEDDVDPDDVSEAERGLSDAIKEITPTTRDEHKSLASVRWLLRLLRQSSRYGFGLSGRFAERLDGKDRY